MADDGPPALLFRSTLLAAGLLVALLALFGWQSWQSVKTDQIQQLQSVAELAEKGVDRYFEQMRASLEVLAERIVDERGLIELPSAQRLLSDFKTRRPELVGVNLIGLDGRFLAMSTSTRLTGLPTVGNIRDFAAIVARERPDVPMELAPPLLSPATQRWVLPIRHAVRTPRGDLVGFLVAAAPVEMLQSFWSEAPVTSRAAIALLRDDGYLLTRYPLPANVDATTVYGKPRDGVLMRYLRDNSFPAQGYVEGMLTLAGENFGTVFVRLEHYPVTLLASVPTAEFWRLWGSRTGLTFLMAGVLALAGLAGYRSLLRRELTWRRRQREAARQLGDSNAFLERAGRVAGVGGWAVDLLTREVTWSAQTRRIHEVDASYLPTLEGAIEFYAPDARPVIQAAVESALQHGVPWDLELLLITATGRSLWVRAQGEVEFDQGKPVRLVGAFQDITEYRRRRVELRNEQLLREQAELHATALDRLLQERGQMLDVLAHEVRQPLNNASAALQAARAALQAQDTIDLARRVDRAQAVLSNVLASIDNTLAVAALLAGTTPLRREDGDIALLLALSMGDLPEEQLPRVQVERDTATRTAGMDTGLMRLAMRNLLANALKYSPPGQPVVVAVLDQDDPPALVIEVRDRGAGFEPELANQLFTRGVRGTAAATLPGLGLGLYIVKRVVDLHGGQIDISAREGGGSIVRLVLPQVELVAQPPLTMDRSDPTQGSLETVAQS